MHTVPGAGYEETEDNQRKERKKPESIPHSCSHHGEPFLSAGLLQISAKNE